MRLSNGLPQTSGIRGLTRVISARTRSVVVSRPTETTGSLDETTTTTTDHVENIWLFEPREGVAEEVAGERINGGLGGLAIADGTVDLEHNDRITHGGVTYEVDTVVGHPEDGDADGSSTPDTDFWVVSFTRRHE